MEIKLADEPVQQVVCIDSAVENVHGAVVFAMLAYGKAHVTATVLICVEPVFGFESLQGPVVCRPQPLDLRRFQQQRHELGTTAFMRDGVDMAQEMLALRLRTVPGEVL